MTHASPVRSEYDARDDLATRYPQVQVATKSSGAADGFYVVGDEVVLLGDHLSERDEQEMLAHFVSHLDLEHGYMPVDDADSARARQNREAQADALAAQRMVELDDLIFALRTTDTPSAAADRLGVTGRIVEARLRNLSREDAEQLARHRIDVDSVLSALDQPGLVCGIVDLPAQKARRRKLGRTLGGGLAIMCSVMLGACAEHASQTSSHPLVQAAAYGLDDFAYDVVDSGEKLLRIVDLDDQ